MTGTQIINSALAEIGVIAAGESPASGDSTFVLGKLNDLLDSWAVKSLYVYVKNHNSYLFSASQQSYTIGPSGADFTAARPIKIERANVVLVSGTPDTHVPLHVINTKDYASLSVPALTSTYPSHLYYQPTVTKGTLWPWPQPTDTANKLELFTWNQLAEIAAASVGSDYPLPPGYRKALILSLAEDLIVPYGKSGTVDVGRLDSNARLARAAISGMNSAPPKMDLSVGGLGSSKGGWSASQFLTGGF